MAPTVEVDLFSDTVTRPTAGMRRAMAEAEVGDEQLGEDPSVNRLVERVAELLGKEAAVYLPSGTMCNEIAFAVHCRPGDEILLDRTAHPLNYEAGGPAVVAGAFLRPLDGRRGIFDARQLAEAIRAPSRYAPRSRVVSVEQTSNLGGGTCWALAAVREICATARSHGLLAHMDGARLLNAAIATGTPARVYAELFDSVWIDLSKGLGAPVGAVLAGTGEFVQDAWRWKQRLGGAMRQAGIVAAAGLYALDHHVERLAEDHARARRLADALAALPGVRLDPAGVETNIVLFDVGDGGMSAPDFAARTLAEHAVRFSVMGPTTVRAVTHLDVSDEGLEKAIHAAAAVLGARSGAVRA
jgi:threonine aldolase